MHRALRGTHMSKGLMVHEMLVDKSLAMRAHLCPGIWEICSVGEALNNWKK